MKQNAPGHTSFFSFQKQVIPEKYRAEYRETLCRENFIRFRYLQIVIFFFLAVMLLTDAFMSSWSARTKMLYLWGDLLLMAVTVLYGVLTVVESKKSECRWRLLHGALSVYVGLFFVWTGFIFAVDIDSSLGFAPMVSCVFIFSSLFIFSTLELVLFYFICLISLLVSYGFIHNSDFSVFSEMTPMLVIFPAAFCISKICSHARKKQFLSNKTISEINENLQIKIFEKKIIEDKLKKDQAELEAKVEDKLVDLLHINETLYEEIQERKRVEEDLIIARDKARESDRLKTSFLTNISHEIRTPMNAIIGFTDLLMHEKGISENIDQYIDIIQTNSIKIIDLIENIIDLAQLEAGILTAEKNQYPVKTLLTEIIGHYRIPANKKPVITIHNPPELKDFFIHTDTIKLRKILTELLDNGIKFSGKNAKIDFYFSCTDNVVEFIIKDDGIGISEEYKEKIFDAFVQEDYSDSRKYGGTGLGLTIAKSFIVLLGGEISVQSEKEKGSTFTFTIPNMK